MKTLIVVQGRGNTGKSAALKKVYDLLKAKYPNASIRYEIVNHDIRAIIEINGLKLGIESQGDPIGRLIESLNLFVLEQCVIIICATRTRGRTYQAVKKLASQFDIIRHPKDRESDAAKHEQINGAFALEIFTEIETLIKTSQ